MSVTRLLAELLVIERRGSAAGPFTSSVAGRRLWGAGCVVLVVTLCCYSSALGQAQGPGVRRLDAEEAAHLEQKLQQLYDQLAPSVVRIFNPKRQGGFSGVIVSASGEVLTCAHHGLAPRTKVTVELAGGRKLQATVLGSVEPQAGAASSYYAADVGLVRLDERGAWPAAKLGRSADLKPGDLCVALGYPNVHKSGQVPLLRLGRSLAPHAVGMLRTTCRIHPGDSGGPLFDLDGRVLAVHTAMESLKTGVNWHSPVESFTLVRERLATGQKVTPAKDVSAKWEPRTDPGGAWEPDNELRKTLGSAQDSTVEVHAEGKIIALGVIVAQDGYVLTKRTVLTGPAGPRRLMCRLSDGKELAARVVAESRPHDMALLQIATHGLPAVRWGGSADLRVGALVATVGPEPMKYGVVGALSARNPARKPCPLADPLAGRALEPAQGRLPPSFCPRRRDRARPLWRPGRRSLGPSDRHQHRPRESDPDVRHPE
jgi:S1-C subfamily serine protease